MTSLNIGVLLISTSGVLGKYISLNPPVTIWYRSLIALFCLGIYCFFKRYSFKIKLKKHGKALFFSGFFMALHWVTYFFALKWSNVAISMLSVFTYPVITIFLEPIFFNSKLKKEHIFFGILIIVGLYFLVPRFDIDNIATQGLLMGLVSAIAYSFRNIILKKHTNMANGSVQMFFQLAVVLILLLPTLWVYPQDNFESQIPYLILLGIITTAIGHTLFLSSFTHFSISSASIMSCIQPVFGVLLAVIFLNEIPETKSLIGGGLILTTVLLENIRIRNEKG